MTRMVITTIIAALAAACAEKQDLTLDNPVDRQSDAYVGYEIRDPSDPINVPTVEITDAPTRIQPNVPYTYIATASDPNPAVMPDHQPGAVVRYDWDFGDGTAIEDGESGVEHTYATSGEFNVQCTVHDDDANAVSAHATVSTWPVWSTGPAMPTARERLAAGVIDGKLYVVGGYTGSSYSNALEVYDPEANRWTSRVTTPFARSLLAAGVIDGEFYVVGGIAGSGLSDLLEIYDPAIASARATR